jgi:hypothetical protein
VVGENCLGGVCRKLGYTEPAEMLPMHLCMFLVRRSSCSQSVGGVHVFGGSCPRDSRF